MKYICLGFMDEKMWEKKSEQERKTFIEECLVYDSELRRKWPNPDGKIGGYEFVMTRIK